MSKISASERKKSATFVQQNRTSGQKYRFPMPDKAHARNALSRLPVAKGLSLAQKEKIARRAHGMLGNKASSKSKY